MTLNNANHLSNDAAEYPLSEPWERISHRWPLLIIGVGLGAALGLIFSIVFPARYQSTAAIAFNIDYGVTEHLPLVVEDRVLDRAYQFITSDGTLELVAEKLRSERGEGEEWQDFLSLRRNTRLDQRLSRWELNGFSDNPETAAVIANRWAEISLDRLKEARDHAWIAAQLQGMPFLVDCIAQLPVTVNSEVLWQCVASAEIESEEVDELRQVLDASHGILPNLTFELIEIAEPPTRPILWSRGALIVAGSLLGLLGAAFVSMLLGPKEREAGGP